MDSGGRGGWRGQKIQNGKRALREGMDARARSAGPAPAVREHGALGARPRTEGGGGPSAGARAAGARAFTPMGGGRGRGPGPGAPLPSAHVPEQGSPQPERPGAGD